MVHRAGGNESGLRWQAEAIKGKGDRLYQPLLVMVHRARGKNRALDGKQRPLGVRATAYIDHLVTVVLVGEPSSSAEAIRGKGDCLYRGNGRIGPQMASRGR